MRKLSFLDRIVEEFDAYAQFTRAPLNPTRKSPSQGVIEGEFNSNKKSI